jgi:hypothetical protein
MRRILAGAAAALMLGTNPLAAQDACSRFVREPAVGGWSAYQLTGKEQPKGAMRFAIVAREDRSGTPMHRLEMTMSDETGKEQMTMQLLVPGWPYEGGAIEEMIMQPAGRPPMQVGGTMLGMMKSQADRNAGMSTAKQCQAMEFVGRESVTVPAGTFQASRFRDPKGGTEVWAADVPFGFVKTVDAEGNSMVLTGHGKGAKSAISGTPRPMGG